MNQRNYASSRLFFFWETPFPTDRVPDPLNLGKIFTLPLQAKHNHYHFLTKYRFTLIENRQNLLLVIHLLPFVLLSCIFGNLLGMCVEQKLVFPS